MIILGIDPGLTTKNPIALAIIDTDAMRVLYATVIKFSRKTLWYERISTAWLFAAHNAQKDDIQAISWEVAFYDETRASRNAQTTIKLAHVGGMAIALAAYYQVPCQPVQPKEAKQALTSDHKATKDDMITAARRLFGQDVVKDVADAIGVAMAGEALLRRRLLVGKAS